MHIGAGIDFMARPIQRVANGKAELSLLDVGCGFGYTLDFFRHVLGKKIAGVEPSTYGRMGRDMLDLPIEICYLSQSQVLKGSLFDIVFSSEVIEHVPEPGVFVEELSEYLNPYGVLILTTPNASYVAPSNAPAMVAAALSPGLHKVLFSNQALSALLQSRGFSHVQIEEQEERLVAFASRNKITLGSVGKFTHEQYVSYLLSRAGEPTIHSDIEIGFRYRAFKELVNLGRVAEAHTQGVALANVIKKTFGLDPFDETAIENSVLSVVSFEEYASKAPYCLGPFLFYEAMRRRVAGEDVAGAARTFAFATKVLAHAIEVAPIYAQEAASLLWRSIMEQGCALVAAGDHARARQVFANILDPTHHKMTALQISLLSKDIVERTRIEDSLAAASMEGRSQLREIVKGSIAQPATSMRLLLRRYLPNKAWNMLRYVYQRWRGW
jgi:SAM-dependent methyltransferase